MVLKIPYELDEAALDLNRYRIQCWFYLMAEPFLWSRRVKLRSEGAYLCNASIRSV